MNEVHLNIECFQAPMESKPKKRKRVSFSDSITTQEEGSENSTKTDEKSKEKPNTQQLKNPKVNVKEKKTRTELRIKLHKLRPEQYLPQRIIEVTVHFCSHPL